MQILRTLLLIVVTVSTLPSAYAEDDAEEETAPVSVQYLELSPGIIASYGAEGGRPRLLNAEITLQVIGDDMAEQIQKYLVPVRHDLIMLFSSLKSDEANSGEQIEALRAKALELVHTSLGEWIKDVQVADLLFTKFVTE